MEDRLQELLQTLALALPLLALWRHLVGIKRDHREEQRDRADRIAEEATRRANIEARVSALEEQDKRHDRQFEALSKTLATLISKVDVLTAEVAGLKAILEERRDR